jgi:uridine phosphorylase
LFVIFANVLFPRNIQKKTPMTFIPKTQLVLHNDGSVYHLRVRPGEVADTILLVGDPQRVQQISSCFDNLEVVVSNREIVTHTGTYRGKRITAMSTGMGTDNIDIVLNELDALFNIDFERRVEKAVKTSLKLVRLGTSGALQPDIAPGDSFVAATHGLGFDGLIHFYKGSEEVIDQSLTQAFIEQTQWPDQLPHPYIVKGSWGLLQQLAPDYIHGITATAPGFYGPQGRALRLPVAFGEGNKKIETADLFGMKITNFEMETSALYGLSRMLGHEALTICLIIANRITEEFLPDYKSHMAKLIQNTLDRLTE